jgi:hypothetical protein
LINPDGSEDRRTDEVITNPDGTENIEKEETFVNPSSAGGYGK